ncbi:MAG: prepilin-type N-terminal cleavage/methylation domain-containing protein [Planctomycetes bacterium]|nr:prepilin-type N-terminal cleavage/methylation domain-containing protein [Planctomycetota bacterium]
MVRIQQMQNCKSLLFRTFTLVELLVVSAILCILAGLLIPSLVKALGQARIIVCLNNLNQMGCALALYMEDNCGVLPQHCNVANASSNVNVWCFSGAGRPTSEGLGSLVYYEYTERSLLACPGHLSHGEGANYTGSGHVHTDYALGWNGANCKLVSPSGTTYSPPNSSWNNIPNWSYWRGAYSPTISIYERQWKRNNIVGSRLLIADAVELDKWCGSRGPMTNKSPSDIPHHAQANFLKTDLSGTSLVDYLYMTNVSPQGSTWWDAADREVQGK